MQEVELTHGECSHPPLHDDVSDDISLDFYGYDIDDDDYDMNSYHASPICPKWSEKTIEAAGDLVGDPHDSRKTRSQFQNAFSTCELNVNERCFMMVGYDPKKYQEASLDPIWKTTMQ